jgi:hypothetical protein
MQPGRPARYDYEYERNRKARRLVARFEWHYTPKHGS